MQSRLPTKHRQLVFRRNYYGRCGHGCMGDLNGLPCPRLNDQLIPVARKSTGNEVVNTRDVHIAVLEHNDDSIAS